MRPSVFLTSQPLRRPPANGVCPILRLMSSAWALLLCAGLVACTSSQVLHNRALARQRTTEIETTYAPPDYILSPGDVITVKFFYTAELNEKLPIRPDGKTSLQLIGDVQAAGLTVPELRSQLAERYAGILKHPEVAVIVNSFESQKVYVGGEVSKPGVIPKTPGLTAAQAIIIAGGHRDTAEMRNVVIVRNQGTEKPLLLMVDLKEGLGTLNNYKDIPLQPQDIVFVPMSEIAELNQFVDQYINKVLPFSRVLGVQYNLGDFGL